MAKTTKEEILALAAENGVKFVRLQFTDLFGLLKNVAITVDQLAKALDNQQMFDGSSIDGFVRIEESDMYLYPDPDSFVIFPWRREGGKVARMICDVYMPDGKPFEGDPRYVLKKVLNEAKDMGYSVYVGPECEFFLFNTDEKGHVTTETHDDAGYFDLGPVDLGENARRDMCLSLEEMGFEIEASHHEGAAGQHEIDFKYCEALRSADSIMTFKLAVKTIAQNHGLAATFMPKPIHGINGSGMHVNISMADENGKNVFYDPDDPRGLSKIAYSYIAGILEHIQGISALTNPLVNSYKRLIPGYEAPVYIAWAARNRSPLIRIPAARGAGTRVELRCPDPSCNPYLALAVILAAGLDGIKRGLTPPDPVEKNIYAMTPAERKAENIGSMPDNLYDAVMRMKEDELVMNTLGKQVADNYIEAKLKEWDEFRTCVHTWETDKYLTKY